MNASTRNSIVGAGLGAGLILLLDPVRGNHRRALIRDKFNRAARKTRDAAEATSRDVGNRMHGLTSRARSLFARDQADDRVLCERVRAELGRVASHPRALTVTASDGCVTLWGDVLASEVGAIMNAVSGVRGVTEVESLMMKHESAEHVPSLQGESERPGHWRTWLREGWSPTAMLAGGILAAGAVSAVARRSAKRSA